MTTIAVVHPLMLSDTYGVTLSAKIPVAVPTIKHRVSPCRRFAYGVAGDLDDAALPALERSLGVYLTTLHQGGLPDVIPGAIATLIGDNPLLVMTRDRVYRTAAPLKGLPRFRRCALATPAVIGSGAGYFLAGWALGMAPEQAALHAATLDKASAPPFTRTHADELVPFAVAEEAVACPT